MTYAANNYPQPPAYEPPPPYQSPSTSNSRIKMAALTALASLISFFLLPVEGALALTGISITLLSLFCCAKKANSPSHDSWFQVIVRNFREFTPYPQRIGRGSYKAFSPYPNVVRTYSSTQPRQPAVNPSAPPVDREKHHPIGRGANR